MELYTLSRRFLPKDSISQFTSAIWTERYASAGDFELVVQPYPSMIDKLAKGTFIGLRGTKEIMQVETQSLENGLLTVTGSSLPKFLNERAAWFVNPDYDGTDTTANLSAEYTAELTTAGQLISSAVNKLVINPVAFTSYWAPINLDWARDKIPGLQLGVVDANGAPKRLSISPGQLYDSIQSLAQEEGLGFKLYLQSASYTGTYVLKFATYRGKDRTSDQTANLLIRLSPKLDSLTDVKEINSITQYKNVFYVVYKNSISTHYIPGLPIPTGFDRRVIVVEAPDLYFNPALPDYAAKVAAFREQVARNTIANHVYIKAVDGRISQQIGYKFGDDYYLGDIIELEGFTGLISKARVTEYIRSQDQFGEQEYPTLAVLDPLFSGYMPDLEPDSDFDPGWDEDPDYDYDYEDDPGWEDDPDTEPSDTDPRDPPDYNPDPTPDYPPDWGGDGGDGDGGDGDGALEVPLTPITAWEVPDWSYDTNRGYYVHCGIVYLCGAANAGVNGDVRYTGGKVVLDNIPADLAPESDVTVQLMIDPLNSSEHFIGGWMSATVSPSGTLTLDAANPAPQTGGPDDYAWISLLLSAVSWPTAHTVADTISSSGSLDDLVTGGTAWSNTDGTYMPHSTRLHFMGTLEAGLTANDNAALVVPAEFLPVKSSEGVPGEGFGYHVFCTPSGAAFHVGPRDIFGDHPLFILGNAGPMPGSSSGGGNTGNPAGSDVFYARSADGKGRGTHPTLSFTPSNADVELTYQGYSGGPSGSLPASAVWRGNSYSAEVSFDVADILTTSGPLGFPVDYTKITGPNQFAFIAALAPSMGAYYKVVFTYDTVFDSLYLRLLIEVCGSSTERASLAEIDITGYIHSGKVDYSFELQVSSDAHDVGFSGTPPIGNSFWNLNGVKGSDNVGSMPKPVIGGKGDMGIHIPEGTTSCKVFNPVVRGIGDFPAFAPGDTVSLDGAGWPIL